MEQLIIAALLMLSTLWGSVDNENPYREEIVSVGMAVSWYESRWTPSAVGDRGCSLGYYQFNVCGGLGSEYPRSILLDGPSNTKLFVEWVTVHLVAGYTMEDILQPWSVRWPALCLAKGMNQATAWQWATKVWYGEYE